MTNSTNELESTYNKFFSQRAKVSLQSSSILWGMIEGTSRKLLYQTKYSFNDQIEKDYANSLRRLVKNFSPKKNTKEEETTQKTEFR